jgi:tight adherence protein C
VAAPALIGSVFVVGGVILLAWLLWPRSDSHRSVGNRTRRRIMLVGVRQGTAGADPLASRPTEPTVAESPVRFGRWARRVTPARMVASLERRTAMAGLRATWPIDRVLGAKVALGGMSLVLAVLVVATKPSPAMMLLGALLVVMGYFLPDFMLFHYSVARQEEIQRELADLIDQITIVVESGLGFDAAIEHAARSGKGPLRQELLGTLEDVRVGVPRGQALERLLERTNSPDLRNFVHAVAQAERYGIPITKILRVQSGELRDKRRQRAEEQGMKIPVKLTLPLVLCILPSLFIVLLGPAAIRIANAGL